MRLLIAVTVLAMLAGCDGSDSASRASTEKAKENARQAVAVATAKRAAAVQKCSDTRAALVKDYDDLTKRGRHWEAARHISDCAEVTGDKDLAARIAAAEIRAFTLQAEDGKLPLRERAEAAQKLVDHYPAVGAKYEKRIPEWIAAADKQDRAAEAKRRRSEGVHIGMSKDDVLASSWGRPQTINTSTTASGVREQWVYGGRNYLYFDGDKLTAIQN